VANVTKDKLQELFPIHHRSGNILLINADCMEVMKHLNGDEFDLACVDQPYGIGEDGKSNHSRGKLAASTKYSAKSWDREPPTKEYFATLMRVSKNQIAWGANHYISSINTLFLDSPCWIVWDKDNSGDFADCELAWTSFKTAVRKFKFTWNGMLQGDMKNKQKRIHPTQKPIHLYSWILQNYAKEGDRILDTHLGSGSSAIAAHYSGYDFVGIELDEDYYKAAVKRFNEETRQIDIFQKV